METWKVGRPDFHVYHILPGCLICSEAEFPLETVSFREASQLCRSANHSCFSIQMLETASSKLLPGAELPVGNCTDIPSSVPSPCTTRPGSWLVPPPLFLCATPQSWLLLQVRIDKIHSDNSELWLKEKWIIKELCVFQTPQ